jgi:hypothetical protein
VSICRIRDGDTDYSQQCNNSDDCHDDRSLMRSRPTRNC